MARFLDSGTLSETYQKPFKSIPDSMISGLVASRARFLDSDAPSETNEKPIKSISKSMICDLVASRARFPDCDTPSETNEKHQIYIRINDLRPGGLQGQIP